MNALTKLGLIITVASLSALSGNSLTFFRPGVGSSFPTTGVEPGMYAGFCQLFRSFDYSVVVNSDGRVEFMVIPFNRLFERYGEHNEYALATEVVDNWGKITFRPERRGIYALVFRTGDTEVVTAGFSMLATKLFEWDFLSDSLATAALGALVAVAGLLVEKASKRRQTS